MYLQGAEHLRPEIPGWFIKRQSLSSLRCLTFMSVVTNYLVATERASTCDNHQIMILVQKTTLTKDVVMNHHREYLPTTIYPCVSLVVVAICWLDYRRWWYQLMLT